jgi:hypothetical protein
MVQLYLLHYNIKNMKRIFTYFIVGALALGATSCKKALDINDNPNQATESTPAVTLPAGIVGTASLNNNYSQSFGYPGGFFANVYGFGAYGATVTLNYGTSDFAGPFQQSYDNAQDYQYIIDNTPGASDVYFNAIARIMKSFVFSKLVDNYNDVPYTEALKGLGMLTPKYDKGSDVYMALVKDLNTAIAAIKAGQAQPSTNAPTKITGASDPMFGGSANMDNWKKFANTLKLRLLVKMAGVPETSSFAATELAAWDASIGVISDDAIVNPGYAKQGGRLAPVYNSLAADENNNRRVTSVIPTKYVYAFYNGGKLNDPGRGGVLYRSFPNTATNQLGQENLASNVIPPAGSTAFYTGSDFDTPGLGAVKGPSQGQPIMILSEALLIKAEAEERGLIAGGNSAAKTDFEAGITASFRYLYKNQNNTVDQSKTTALETALANYKAANPDSYLVNYDLATTAAQRLEAIITQKYIALNQISHDEAFAEYRRTNYPISTASTTNPITSFASIQSRATSPDKLITRVPYPQSEYNVNSANVPQNVNIYTAKIFWDLN